MPQNEGFSNRNLDGLMKGGLGSFSTGREGEKEGGEE
jgi:hypothetical protein